MHLADVRYEVRDTQDLAGKLADQGLIDGQRIGVTGGSYAAASRWPSPRSRTATWTRRQPEPWESDSGQPMRIAASAPTIPWTDLAYSLEPNGRTSTTPSPKPVAQPITVVEAVVRQRPVRVGQATGYYSPPGVDPGADVTTQFTRVNAGEPSDPTAQAIVTEIQAYHSSYYLDHSEAPAPLLIANGFTDDLFPTDEALPSTTARRPVPRRPHRADVLRLRPHAGPGKAADTALLQQHQYDWFDHYVKGDASAPTLTGVQALTQTCPKDAPSGGPYNATDWNALHPGEVRFKAADPEDVSSAGGDPTINAAVDPIAGGGNACTTTSSANLSGTATYRLAKVTGKGYTLLGAPTVIADLKVKASTDAVNTELAARPSHRRAASRC